MQILLNWPYFTFTDGIDSKWISESTKTKRYYDIHLNPFLL